MDSNETGQCWLNIGGVWAGSISGGTTGSLVELEFKSASLASTMEAIIADNWSGTCGAVFVVESLSWRRVIKTRRGPVWLDGVVTA